ncbi:hypothetical protein ACIA8K_18700 [Catenuloplanes sp. NPDC051500]|uniref:hypothetical protein n=1 Tax=Catenuloplanes sp. NPDC051500 TaxID=3363959 RepID=UPI0037B38ED3
MRRSPCAGNRPTAGGDAARDHVRRYLRAPFLADLARRARVASHDGDVVTPGVPRSLRRVLEEWAVDESTPDEEIAEFIGWPVDRVREHR